MAAATKKSERSTKKTTRRANPKAKLAQKARKAKKGSMNKIQVKQVKKSEKSPIPKKAPAREVAEEVKIKQSSSKMSSRKSSMAEKKKNPSKKLAADPGRKPDMIVSEKDEKQRNKENANRTALGVLMGICLSLVIAVIIMAIWAQLESLSVESQTTIRIMGGNKTEEIKEEKVFSLPEESMTAEEDQETTEETIEGEQTDTSQPTSQEITTGPVQLNDEELQNVQNSVNTGSQPWRVDPLLAAMADGDEYGFSQENDQWELKSKSYEGEYSGTGEAEVSVIHDGQTYIIQLVQPIESGESGIWAINNIYLQK